MPSFPRDLGSLLPWDLNLHGLEITSETTGYCETVSRLGDNNTLTLKGSETSDLACESQ